jgi:hypothetical protein
VVYLYRGGKMAKKIDIILLFLAILLPSVLMSQDKLAQTGFQFLSVGVDARATAMGESFVTFENTSASLFYNPAGIARLNSTLDIRVNHHNYIADINYISGTIAVKAFGGKYGVFGLSYLAIDYGDFIGTKVADTDLGYVETGTFSPSASVIGLGYGFELSESFSVGANVKYAYQSLGSSIVPSTVDPDIPIDEIETFEEDYSKGVLAFDFGTRYSTGYRSLVFAMSVTNFSQEIKYELESFQLPLTFRFGVAMNLFDFFPQISDFHKFLFSLDALHPRAAPEHIRIGGEYIFMDAIAIRAGYSSNSVHDATGLTFGFGVSQFGIGIDYSYTPFDIFDNIQRLSIHFSF